MKTTLRRSRSRSRPATTPKSTTARRTAPAKDPLDAESLRKIDAWWRAANYLSVGQIYLYDNPLLKEPLSPPDEKAPQLLEQWAARAKEIVHRRTADEVGGRPALTTAELRALQYLPTHLSLKEIGERLFITRNTVKTHTIAIYRKLDVTSRSEAVERGRELGLLDA